MSSFNKITKYNYSKNVEDPVSLKEYVIFDDERKEEKYILLKLQNNLQQVLRRIVVEISEYDKDDYLIERTTLNYGPFEVNALEDFIPKAKYKANYNCCRIGFKLINAHFEKINWTEGSYTIIPYTRKDFVLDFPVSNDVEIKDEPVEEVKKPKKKKTKILDITGASRPVAPRVWCTIFGIILIGLTVFAAIWYSMNTKYFSSGDLDFTPTGEKTASVMKCTSLGTSIKIPEKVDGYLITEIGEKAFMNSNVKEVTLSSNIKIQDFAFYNSKLEILVNSNYVTSIGKSAFEGSNIQVLNVPKVTSLGTNAFKNCGKLQAAHLENCSIPKNAFEGCNSLNNITFKDTACSYFYELFGGNVPSSLTTISTSKGHISDTFFDDCYSVKNLNLLNNPTVDYPAFEQMSLVNYTKTESSEILNGVIVSQTSTDTLVITSSMSYQSLLNAKSTTKSITLDNIRFDLKKEYFSSLTDVSTLIIYGSIYGDFDAIDLPSLKILYSSSSINLKYISDATLSLVTELTVNSGDCYDCLKNMVSLEKLELNDVALYDNSLEGCLSLRKLTSNSLYPLNELGISSTIEEFNSPHPTTNEIPKAFAVGCSKLKSLEFGVEITSVNSYLASNCPLLETINLPDTISFLSKYMIGKNCKSLTEVVLPFVGLDDSYPISYMDLNLSYSYTKSLIVTESCYLSQNTFLGCSNIEAIAFKDNVSFEVYSLDGLSNLKYLELYDVSNSIIDLFNSSEKYIEIVAITGSITYAYAFKNISNSLVVLYNTDNVNYGFFDYLDVGAVYVHNIVNYTKQYSVNPTFAVAFTGSIPTYAKKWNDTYSFSESEMQDAIPQFFEYYKNI